MSQLGGMDPADRANILVVDDEGAIRDLLAAFLGEQGYAAVTAANGEEALVLLEAQTFELAIVDIMMPGIDGMEVLRRVTASNGSTSVIMMTGYASVESAVRAMQEGAYDYVTKPFKLERMGASVARAVERCVLARAAAEKEHYRQLSITDGLTGLCNHRHFHEELGREVARAQRYSKPLSLLMADVDDFKAYNDSQGHLAGDRALRDLAGVLSAAVRNVDIVARYGGEEFALLLPEADGKGAWTVARNVCQRVEAAPFEREDILPGGALTVSVGLASLPNQASTAEELLLGADEALYEAKRQGKNRACVLPHGDTCTTR